MLHHSLLSYIKKGFIIRQKSLASLKDAVLLTKTKTFFFLCSDLAPFSSLTLFEYFISERSSMALALSASENHIHYFDGHFTMVVSSATPL
jgi:hypothetical protein